MAQIAKPHHFMSAGFLSSYFAGIIESKLPRRLKRLIYISSILGLIQQVKDPDMKLVEKLNDVFKIAKHPDAYIFPMYIKSIIWKNVSIDSIRVNDRTIAIVGIEKQELSTLDYNAVGKYFAENAPKWLRYGSTDLMTNDIMTLISQLKNFKNGLKA